ncbi:MAG: hypothetical protein ACLU38_08535 [Dysosmobacter sp.]
MILTDTDLFPPGTIRLNGVKVYGEELGKVSAYAAAAARAAGCGLERVFEGLAVGENAPRETAQDLSFYEQGGFGCTIHGESVLLGTASFLRKQDVRLPSNINLKTGIFLAIDHQLSGGVRREVRGVGKCGLRAADPAPQPDHADSGSAGPQHHPGAAEAEVL